MNSNDFRKELVKIMPGYSWTVHRDQRIWIYKDSGGYMEATGIQTAGFNRLSTLRVVRRERDGQIKYEVRSSGYGVKAPWLAEHTDTTLARALRGLQNHYEDMARLYGGHAGDLQIGRQKPVA